MNYGYKVKWEPTTLNCFHLTLNSGHLNEFANSLIVREVSHCSTCRRLGMGADADAPLTHRPVLDDPVVTPRKPRTAYIWQLNWYVIVFWRPGPNTRQRKQCSFVDADAPLTHMPILDDPVVMPRKPHAAYIWQLSWWVIVFRQPWSNMRQR